MRDCVIACVCASKRKGGKLTESNLSYGASIVTHSRRNALDVYAENGVTLRHFNDRGASGNAAGRLVPVCDGRCGLGLSAFSRVVAEPALRAISARAQ